MNNQLGFSLTEVLVSLFLASLLMTALGHFYLNTKHYYIEAQERLEEHFDLQWVNELLSDSIRRAGFTPCLGIENLETMDMRTFESGVKAFQINKNSQLIQINRMSQFFAEVLSFKSPTEFVISKDNPLLNDKRPIIIADCEHAEVHQVLYINKDAHMYSVKLKKPLFFHYSDKAYVGEWLEEQWFIKTNPKGNKSFYYHLAQTEELSSRIHSLQIENVSNSNNVIQVIMNLDKEKNYEVLAAVRGS